MPDPLARILWSIPVLAVAACSGGSKGDPDNRGDFKVTRISNGRGSLFPYRIRSLDSFGNPTTTVVEIEDMDTLRANVRGVNGVLPIPTFVPAPELPDGSPGNHFLAFEFSHKLAIDSILSDQPANQVASGLTTALTLVAYDPATESSTVIPGRGFVDGQTFFNEGGQLRLVRAVERDGDTVRILDARATGFPQYPGAASLVGPKVFTFVADADGNLATAETFPTGRLLRLSVTSAVRDTENDILDHAVATATTVGPDPDPPQVLGFTAAPAISPGNGQTGIEPTTTIFVRFNKPVQPGLVGSFFDPQQLAPLTGGLTLSVTAATQTFEVLYHADPIGFGDLTHYVVTPAYNLPGLAQIDVIVPNTRITGLEGALLGQGVTTSFRTASGPGIVNAPVAPEAIYVGVGGASPGLSVIDLNGFGQGTGDLQNTRFPLNPNIGAPGVVPSLVPGTTNFDAGSAGALTLARDTNLDTRLLREPLVGEVRDVHVGAPLDLVFNNENVNANATRANQVNPITNVQQSGNCISVAPHPNPPRLVFPPPNPLRSIFGEEPTVAGGQNLLVRGNPFSSQMGQLGVFGTIQNGVFNGPAQPPPSPPPPAQFLPFNVRQQVGHFLYVLDSDNRQILVLNSNRFTILDTIRQPDPVDLAMSPDLSRLAVANYASASVQFVDIDPLSPSFHQVVAETRTEPGPISVAWQPDGEDILVVCDATNVLSIIRASDFTIRRTASGFLNEPIDIAVTPRFQTTGFAQGIYFAYVLNGNGTIAVYESGPDGVNGIGFDDVIGSIPGAVFPRARRLRYDYSSANGALWIGHADEAGLGVVSRLDMTSSPGVTPLNPNSSGFILPPTFRQKEWDVVQRIGGSNPTTPVRDFLSGNSVIDVAVDELVNQGGQLGQFTPFAVSPRPSFGHSGKDAIKGGQPAIQPRFLFVAISDRGVVDVFEISTGRRVTTIDAPGVRTLGGYWRQ